MLHRIYRLLTTTFDIWSETNASRNSAAMTYYSMLSLAPLLLISIATAGIFFCNQQVEQEIVQYFHDIASPEVADTIASLLSNTTSTSNTVWASLVSIAVMLYGASGVFTQLFDTINDIWGVPFRQRSGIRFTARKRLIGIFMVLMMGTLLIASLAMGAVISYFSQILDGNFPRLSTWLALIDRSLSFFLVPFVLSLMFWYLPMRKMRWPDVWPAAGITAGMLAGSRYLIDFYLRISTASEVYGAAGSLVVFLVWIYLTGQVLFLGACFSRAWTMHFGSESVSASASASKSLSKSALASTFTVDSTTNDPSVASFDSTPSSSTATAKEDQKSTDINGADDIVALLVGQIVDDVSISVSELPSIRLYQPFENEVSTEADSAKLIESTDVTEKPTTTSFKPPKSTVRSIDTVGVVKPKISVDEQAIPIIRRRQPISRKSA